MELAITTYLSLDNSFLKIEGKSVYENSENDTLQGFLKAIYKSRIGEYPKFHKMDVLSKVATIFCNELVDSRTLIQDTDQYAMIFANAVSSKTVDKAFQESVEKNNASPSLFVYTLPNICIGEVTIKNKWTGDSIFCIQEKFDYDFFKEQVIAMQVKQEHSHYICAWIDDNHGKLDAFLFLVEASNEKNLTLPFSKENLINIYNSK